MNIHQVAGAICAAGSTMVNNAGILACLRQASPKLAKIIKIKVFIVFDSYLHYIAANMCVCMYGYLCYVGCRTLYAMSNYLVAG